MADADSWFAVERRGRIVAQRATYPGAETVQAVAPPAARRGPEAVAWPSDEAVAAPTVRGAPSIGARLRRDWVMLALAAPGVAYFLVFYYLPLLGYVIAFQDYQPFLGFDSPWVGTKNFADMLRDPRFWQAVINTIQITVLQLVLYFPAPLLLALMLNSIMSVRVRRFVQNVVYLPHFLSWVIVVALFQEILGGAGVVNHLLRDGGLSTMNVMADPSLFKWLMVFQLIWKETGWGTIIYLAALLSIDSTLYEAAAVDGANRWARLWHVTVPGILGVTVLLLILRLGTILTVGFEQILLQRTFVGPEAGEVLDTYVYFNGIVGGQWGVTAAAGLVKGIVGLVLVLSANKIAHRLGQDGVYR
jgi:putative aldouronate transport system permease protein